MMASAASSCASLAIRSAFLVLQCPLFQKIALRGVRVCWWGGGEGWGMSRGVGGFGGSVSWTVGSTGVITGEEIQIAIDDREEDRLA